MWRLAHALLYAKFVTPVKTGAQFFRTSRNYWIPAFAGMTENVFDMIFLRFSNVLMNQGGG